jgi:biopolymer transport protein ExbD
MAEIASPTRRRGIPAFIKLDMTPLVDLAFLLLSFFILTTSLRREAGIELGLGAGKHPSKEGTSITLLVSGRDRVHAYAGVFDPDSTRVRRYGLDQVRAALHAVRDTAHFTCNIRTHATATYDAVVQVLDEAAFLGPAHYNVQEGLGPEEAEALEPLLANEH